MLGADRLNELISRVLHTTRQYVAATFPFVPYYDADCLCRRQLPAVGFFLLKASGMQFYVQFFPELFLEPG